VAPNARRHMRHSRRPRSAPAAPIIVHLPNLRTRIPTIARPGTAGSISSHSRHRSSTDLSSKRYFCSQAAPTDTDARNCSFWDQCLACAEVLGPTGMDSIRARRGGAARGDTGTPRLHGISEPGEAARGCEPSLRLDGDGQAHKACSRPDRHHLPPRIPVESRRSTQPSRVRCCQQVPGIFHMASSS